MVVSVRYKLKFKDVQDTVQATMRLQKTNFVKTLAYLISLAVMVLQITLMVKFFIEGRYSFLLKGFINFLILLTVFLFFFPLTESRVNALITFGIYYLTQKTEIEVYLDESSFCSQTNISRPLKWEEIRRVIEFSNIFLVIPRKKLKTFYGVPKRVLTDADIDAFKQILVSHNIELEQL